jgi:DNA-binding NarL/FixJ family response regulator
MSRAIPQIPVTVCCITRNCLVEAYLTSLLKPHPRLRLLNWERYERLSPVARRDTVFVIDQRGLEIPLCECLKKLKDFCPAAKFLVLDYEKSKQEILRQLVMGTQGFVPHAKVSGVLSQAILCVAAGQLWVPPEVQQEFFCEIGHILRRDVHSRQTTTPREDEILELVRRRLSNREIADLLKIRVSTVKFHVANIFSKLNANNRRELADSPFAGLPLGSLKQGP